MLALPGTSWIMNHLRSAFIAWASVCAGAAAAAVNPLQGSWTTTLHGRDYNGDLVADAFYDSALDITWLADANLAQTRGQPSVMVFSDATNWAENLRFHGTTGWRLPRVSPVNGVAYQDSTPSDDGSTDLGTARAGVGWGTASELGHLFYVTLGNSGCGAPYCVDSALSNTGPFSIGEAPSPFGPSRHYWSDWNRDFDFPRPNEETWLFDLNSGFQWQWLPSLGALAWAVHDGDVPSVPLPPSWLLLLAALPAVIGAARRRRQPTP